MNTQNTGPNRWNKWMGLNPWQPPFLRAGRPAPKPGNGLCRRLCLFALLVASASLATAQYSIPWFKMAGGGGMQSTGGVYTLSGTIGQIDAGRVAYTNAYRIEGGFWAIAIQQLGYPPLTIMRADTNYFVTWQTLEPGLILQQAATLATPTSWSDVSELTSTNGITNLVQQALASGVSNRYYRLRRP